MRNSQDAKFSMKPNVSVVIPAYNAMKFLPQTVESALHQTYTDFEILIINDGSSDDIVSWATQLTTPKVKLITQENQGQAGARNTGIRLSQGQYIAFLDADDVWEPTKLEKQVAAFLNNPELGLVDVWVMTVDEQGKLLSRIEVFYDEGSVWHQMLEENLVMCGSSPMVRRDCFETVGLFDLDIQGPEDWHMWTRIAAHYPLKVIKEHLVHYRQHSSSTTRNLELMHSNIVKAIESLYKPVPSQLQWKKRRAYSRAYLYLAALAEKSNHHSQVMHFLWRAFSTYPQFCLTKDKLRLITKTLIRIGLSTQPASKLKRLT